MSVSKSTAAPFAGLSRYVYGTTRLGSKDIPFDERLQFAGKAMAASIWFHTSEHYGTAFSVLREAFDRDRDHVPNLIVKLGYNTWEEISASLPRQMDALGIEQVQIGQLCFDGVFGDEVRNKPKAWEKVRALKASGRVDRFVLEVYPWISDIARRAILEGYSEGIFDALTFYFNPLQCFVSNELWDVIQERNIPILAIRTVGGGDVHRLAEVPGAAWMPYLRDRAIEVVPIYDRSGCRTWAEFCVRFALGIPQLSCTIGATINPQRFDNFISEAQHPKPLAAEIQDAVLALHRRWADDPAKHPEHD